jgi:hypothetical protein
MNIYQNIKQFYEILCTHVPFLYLNCDFEKFLVDVLANQQIIVYVIRIINFVGKNNLYKYFSMAFKKEDLKKYYLIVTQYLDNEEINTLITMFDSDKPTNTKYSIDFFSKRQYIYPDKVTKEKLFYLLNIIKAHFSVKLEECNVTNDFETWRDFGVDKEYCLTIDKIHCTKERKLAISLLLSFISNFNSYESDDKYLIFGALLYCIKRILECKVTGGKTYKKNKKIRSKKKSKTHKSRSK